MDMEINPRNVCLFSAARECARHGLLSEACHTRTTHAARLDTTLRGGASAQVSLTTTMMMPNTWLNLWYLANDTIAAHTSPFSTMCVARLRVAVDCYVCTGCAQFEQFYFLKIRKFAYISYSCQMIGISATYYIILFIYLFYNMASKLTYLFYY